MRWHRAGFRSYWRWKSRRGPGRPAVSEEIRQLIRDMSIANPLWGAPRIHGELLKIGIDVGQTSVAKYMARKRGPPSQGWKTFLLNHADGIAAMDLFVVPTVSFRLLYGFLIMGHSRRRIFVAWRDGTSNCRVASQPTHTSLRLGAPSELPDPRPGCLLWQSVCSAGSFSRHSRSSDITAFALAERLCGPPDRLDPPGMSRSCRCVRRAAPAAFAVVLYELLQLCSNPPIAGKGTPLLCALCMRSDASNHGPSSVGCTINISGFD